ncbi:MAG: ERCC4 domain-containing protein [Candidatus Pacearchaeota archaeon]|nr:ERCC4 domain-containing protein [Candidatus Pacearchaeota archaeon]
MPKLLNIFSKKKLPQKTAKQKIIIDNREKNSLIPSILKSLGFEMEFKQLPVGDYIINDFAIERKTLSDFKSSIINKRIISQLLELKQYPNPILILEGLENENLYIGSLHENAFRGFILSIIRDFKTPIIFTLNEKDTAKYLEVLAKKQIKSPQTHGIRATKIFLTEKEQLQYILEGFPQIGPSTAKSLLNQFKSLKSIFNASEEELKKTIGKKAESFYNLIHKEY